MISVLAYAKLRGVSHVAVIKAIKAGRLSKSITMVSGKAKINDPALADQEWEANTDVAQRREKKESKPKNKAVVKESPQPEQTAVADKMPSGPTYAQSRAIREAYQARLSKLEYEEKSAKLHKTDECRVEQFNRARKARDMLITIPDRLAPALVHRTDQREIHRILADEIRVVCEQLADAATYDG